MDALGQGIVKLYLVLYEEVLEYHKQNVVIDLEFEIIGTCAYSSKDKLDAKYLKKKKKNLKGHSEHNKCSPSCFNSVCCNFIHIE